VNILQILSEKIFQTRLAIRRFSMYEIILQMCSIGSVEDVDFESSIFVLIIGGLFDGGKADL